MGSEAMLDVLTGAGILACPGFALLALRKQFRYLALIAALMGCITGLIISTDFDGRNTLRIFFAFFFLGAFATLLAGLGLDLIYQKFVPNRNSKQG